MEPNEIKGKTFPLVRRGYDTKYVNDFLQDIASEFQTAIQAAERAARAPRDVNRAGSAPGPDQEFQEIGTHVAAILASAAQAAEETKAASEEDADVIRRTAAQEVAEAREEAAQHLAAAEEERARTEREAAAARAGIRSQAARVQKEAQERAAALEAEARESARRVEQDVRQHVDAILAAGRSRCQRLRTLQQRSLDRLSSLEALIRDARVEVSAESSEDPFAGGLSSGSTVQDLGRQRVAREVRKALSNPVTIAEGGGDGTTRP